MVDVLISICNLYFIDISGYGTYVASSPNLLKRHEYSVWAWETRYCL